MFFRLLAVSFLSFSSWVWAANPPLNATEQALYDKVNAYRQQNGLSAIPISPALTQVARTHVADLGQNTPTGSCNLHSWSSQGSWGSCCYTGNDQAQCMWDKPRELSSYQGTGYENAYMNSRGVTPDSALSAWQRSSGHNQVILNQSIWANVSWNAIGIGIEGDYAVLWFGEETDTSQFDNNTPSNSACEVAFFNQKFSIQLPEVLFANQAYRFDLDYIGGYAFKLNPNTLSAIPLSGGQCHATLSQSGRLSIPQLNLFDGQQAQNVILNWDPSYNPDLVLILE